MKFFEADDFNGNTHEWENQKFIRVEYAVDICNGKLEREGRVIHGHWTRELEWTVLNGATHKALLINIEPLECQHEKTRMWEPHLAGARKCLDCGLVYNKNINKWYCEHPNEEISMHCDDGGVEYTCKCGVELIPSSFKAIKNEIL